MGERFMVSESAVQARRFQRLSAITLVTKTQESERQNHGTATKAVPTSKVAAVPLMK